MKRILLLALLLAGTLSSFAQRVASLRIKLSTNQMLAVSVDDRYYERRGTSVTIGDIPSGRHYIKVYTLRVGRSGDGRANMVYSGYVDLKADSRNMAVVDPYQRKMTMRTTQTFDKDDNDVYENWNDRRDDQRDNRRDDRRNDNRNDRYDDNVLRNQEVTELETRVNDRSMDGDKLKLVQSVLTNRTYYTDQLRTMLGWFSFESTKLEFAKWAYDNTVDKDNYWKLEDVFSFSTSKNELTDFIESRPISIKERKNRRNYEYNSANPNAISDQDVTDLSSRVKDRAGDTDKLKLVKSVLKGKEYYTEQLRTMLGWFSFESTKLDFAKWAYAQTLDQENYWKLENVFSFSSSKDELTDYIQNNRR